MGRHTVVVELVVLEVWSEGSHQGRSLLLLTKNNDLL